MRMYLVLHGQVLVSLDMSALHDAICYFVSSGGLLPYNLQQTVASMSRKGPQSAGENYHVDFTA